MDYGCFSKTDFLKQAKSIREREVGTLDGKVL